MKERVKKIYLPVFEYMIHVIISDDIMKSRSKRDLLIGHSFKTDGEIGALHSYDKDKPESFLFFRENPNANNISHECYHCISRLFKWIEADHEEELFAYHFAYLVGEVVDFAYNKKKR